VDSFIAIDYETANGDRRSACSIGISVVEVGKVIDRYQTLIKPPEEFSYFDPFNVMIHGINARDVQSAPNFPEVWDVISKINKKNQPVVCHNSGFDMRLTEDLLKYFKISFEDINFYDTLTIAKKLWPSLINHKLNTISQAFKIELEHHNAASDAEACARIAIQQMHELEKKSLEEVAGVYDYKLGRLSINGVITMSASKNYNVHKTFVYDPKAVSSKTVLPDKEINYGSELFGTSIVFTGELQTMDRKQAIQVAVNNGASVTSSVTKKTQFLVVGISDFIDFTNGKKTRKLVDAEKLSVGGQHISIIDEEDFLKMSAI
jgi:DNA polymerase III subunit epsilon